MTYEELQIEYSCLNIKEMDLSTVDGLKGLYIDGNIAIQSGMTSIESSCTLAEELGHHETSAGNILDMSDVRNKKQEHKARLWAYNKQIGLWGLMNAFQHGCHGRTEVAEYLGVTEEFLEEAIECYRGKYGCCVDVDDYTIFFDPALAVMKKIDY